LEVAADWHELVVPWCIMQLSIAHKSIGPPVQHDRHTTAPIYYL